MSAGKREDDAGGDGLPGIAGGLHDDGFEHRGLALVRRRLMEMNRDGDGGGHGESGAQAHVDGDSAEDDAEDGAQQDGAKSKFGAVFVGRDEGAKGGLLFCHFGFRARCLRRLRRLELSLKGECSSQEPSAQCVAAGLFRPAPPTAKQVIHPPRSAKSRPGKPGTLVRIAVVSYLRWYSDRKDGARALCQVIEHFDR